MLKVVHDTDEQLDATAVDEPVAGTGPDLDELCRLAARQMIAVALEAERRAYLDAHADHTDAAGRRLVVGNGYANERTITTAAGMVEVRAPRVDDRREGEQFVSALLPPYMRKSPKVTEVLPILYLRGLSTGDFAPALEGFFGSDAGLSASTVNRLTTAWQAEHADWSTRDLAGVDYVYIWADGIHVNVRLPDAEGNADRLCLLVIVGVRPDGTKELVAVADGYREDTESWLDLLRDLRARGMAAPELAVGDGALGFWAALRQVWPATREQRCWVHKVANCLAALPKRAHPEAKAALKEIYGAENRTAAVEAAHTFATDFAAHPRRPPRSPTSSTRCWRSSTSPKNTGSTCAPPTRSSRRSRPCGYDSAPPKGPAAAPPAWRWPTSSWTQPSIAGDGSTATNWSRSSARARRSSTASYKRGATPTSRRPLTSAPPEHLEEPRPQLLTITPSSIRWPYRSSVKTTFVCPAHMVSGSALALLSIHSRDGTLGFRSDSRQ